MVREIDVGPDPLLAVGTDDSVWTLNLDDSTLTRVDVTSGETTRPPVGEAVGIASDGSDVWVATDGRRLVRLDGATGAVEGELTLSDRDLFGVRNAGFLVVGEGSVWLTVPPTGGGGRHEVWRIDPDDGRVLSTIPIGNDPFPPMVAEGAIWMIDAEGQVIQRVDLGSERVVERDIGVFPGAIAGGEGQVWASTPGSIHELDPATGRVRHTIDVPGTAARGLAWAQGKLWIATDVGVTVVDAETGGVAHEIGLAEPSDDEGPIAIVPLGGSVWVTIETA